MNLKALSMFSSIGIAEMNFRNYGIETVVANEIDIKRADLYRKIFPETDMIQGSILDESVFKEMIEKSKKKKVNFVISTPPCQGMSSAGKQDPNDERNLLISYTIEAIEILNPDYVLIENVPEMLTTKINFKNETQSIGDIIYSTLGENYTINEKKVVNSSDYGVPQSRERAIFLMVKKNKNLKWEFPSSENYEKKTVRDAIGHIPTIDPYIVDVDDEVRNSLFPHYNERESEALTVSPFNKPPKHQLRHVIAMSKTPEGKSAFVNKYFYPRLANGTKSKGYKNTYKRNWWDRPAYTITRYTSRIGSQENGHPGRILYEDGSEFNRMISDARVFTVYELMLLTTFPENIFIPPETSHNLLRECIGDAVPPKLISAALDSLQEIIGG